ncbi:hypothetical protein BDQ12DRAFT_686670 [Crucibulum laeve]|uniref:Nudix hydrolase domain-containing protein n=1 Tax=Crucibulum laeve TaxID=68775 RepID=A0A5C3LVK0_9AGAR|nr:hypothetical protein BDQ12DRAFT_686670 [Crucibulum laeve]
MFGAGMVLIQEQTHKIVLLWESERKYWFFPRGRKDRGESIESTALREAWEEVGFWVFALPAWSLTRYRFFRVFQSGYRAKFLPHYGPSQQPSAPEVRETQYFAPHCEPIFITTRSWRAKGERRIGKSEKQPPRDGAERIDQLQNEGGEYITTWFLGSIALHRNPPQTLKCRTNRTTSPTYSRSTRRKSASGARRWTF